jgi:serine/threonine-protein kinase
MIGLGAVLLFGLLTVAGALRAVEGVAYDAGIWAAGSRTTGERVTVVAVDDASLQRLGAWPWSRYTLAEVNALVSRGGPRAIGYTLPLETPQNEHGQRTLRRIYEQERDALDARGRAVFERAIREMGTDRVLAASFRPSAPVVLGARYRADRDGGRVPDLPVSIGRNALPVAANGERRWLADLFGPGAALAVQRVHPPVEQLGTAAAAVGLGLATEPDRQRALHLAMRHGESWLPSIELLLAARSWSAGSGEIIPGTGVRVGERVLRTASDLAVYPVYRRNGGDAPFEIVSAADVHARVVSPERFRDRIVLIGRTAPSLVEPIATAGGSMAPVLATAHRVSALLQGRLMQVPDWAVWTRLAAFGIVALYLMFGLPRLRLATGVAVSVVLGLVLFNTELLAMMMHATWIPLMAPLSALVGGHAVLGAKRAILNRIAGFQSELSQANRQLGEAHRARGELDEAFRRLRRCSADDDTMESIYALGLDFERRRRFAQAVEAFRYCRKHRGAYRDVDERIERNEQLQNSVALGRGSSGTTATRKMLLGDTAVEKPMLGRFEIERELGKGAMGVVYLGRDPKIGRQVAIKTLALEEELEGESIEEIKGRFLREAETAGRLEHSNIVAVHDVGEDQDLAWIAMDYLAGEPLSRYTGPASLLPPAEVMEYMAQVAEALQFAHDHRVVHRDVKPENIIVDREKQRAVVTDFGVAALLDQSRTRSGVVLGTPKFMSPEQLGGRKLDGRSDQFSLGVTAYQLLCGELPFTGDSFSNLMYEIANKRHRDIRHVNPDLPTCASTITNRAMHKKPDRRYASATQMAQAFRRCGPQCG